MERRKIENKFVSYPYYLRFGTEFDPVRRKVGLYPGKSD